MRDHEAGPRLPERFGTKPQLRELTGPEVLDEGVAARDQAQDDLDCFLVLQVERD